jgi:hypothetical protein
MSWECLVIRRHAWIRRFNPQLRNEAPRCEVGDRHDTEAFQLIPLIFAMSYGQSAHCLECSANPDPWSSFAKAPFLAHAGQVAKFPLGKRKETAAGPPLNLGSLRRQVTRRRGSWAEPGTFATAVRHARGNQRQEQNVPCEGKCIAGPCCTIGSEPREFYAREFGCPPDVLM